MPRNAQLRDSALPGAFINKAHYSLFCGGLHVNCPADGVGVSAAGLLDGGDRRNAQPDILLDPEQAYAMLMVTLVLLNAHHCQHPAYAILCLPLPVSRRCDL